MQDLTESNYVLYCVCLQPFLEMEEREGSKQKQPGFIICSSLWLSWYPLACQTQSLKTPTHCLSSSKYTKVSNTTLTQSALPQPKWKYCTSNTWWKSMVHATLSFQKSATVPIHFPVDPQQQRTCCYFRHKGNVIRSCTYLQVRGDGSLRRLSGSPLLHGERGKNSAFPCKSSSNETVATVSLHLANTEIIIAYIEKTAMWLCTTYMEVTAWLHMLRRPMECREVVAKASKLK